jgi:hypothetical protein
MDLFDMIDPRPFQAVLDQAKGQLAQAEAQMANAELNVKRDIPEAEAHAIPQSQLDSDTESACDSAETLLQLTVHRFKFSTADITELAQGILGLGCPGLNFFGSKVGLRIPANNVLNNPFSTREHIG